MPRTMDRDARKNQLAEAVWQVILDQGISAVSVRTVAERAGVAVGSLRHVFPSRAELVQFSAELMVQRATDRLHATYAEAASHAPEARALALIREVLPLTPDTRAEFEVNLALLAERAAVPELHRVRGEAHQRLAGLCGRIVEMLTSEPGSPAAVVTAQRLHALIDGLAFHLFHQPPEADSAWALDIVRAELGEIAAPSGDGVEGCE
ncbi:TetR/AcrR family transcriptional regulator [Nesterenkonia sp. K-15-9-6]|uniref:TetR/AcrR family transcriptional regulator n=1 Tax=Nesterenkonia sp. K-15-9-6 TaxID=3093918 RepID=UPI004044B72A